MKNLLRLVTLTACLVLSATAGADVFTVDRTDDPDPTTAQGCDDAVANDCSLRGAVVKANASTGVADVITLPSSAAPYTLTIPEDGFNAGAGGDLDVTDDLTIDGGGATSTVIDGNGATIQDRVLQISPSGFPVAFHMDGVTLQNGKARDSLGGLSNTGEHGGGIIINNGTTTLTDVVIRNSVTGKGAVGNGLGFNGGLGGSGGGLAMGGNATVTLDRVTVSGNTTAIGGPPAGSLSVGRSGDGGGIAVLSGTLTIINSTVSGNRTGNGGDGGSSFGGGDAGAGGGIFVSLGTVSLNNATVAENGAGSGGPGTTPGDGGVGGGIVVNSGSLNLKNTLVADNEAAVGGPDCFGTITSQGFNLIGDGTNCSGPVNGVSNDQVGSSGSPIDPLLGSLQDNGGGLPTQALLADSPAVNAGDNATCASTDERGLSRPQGTSCDIGAYEKGACGDGLSEPEESCDDGNLVSGDGCDDGCQTEAGETTGATAGATTGAATAGGTGTATGGTSGNTGGGCSLIR